MDEQEVRERLAAAVSSGAAVCLFGAGFSRLALDANGKPVSENPSTQVDRFQFLEEVVIPSGTTVITTEDFVRLILRGDMDLSKLRTQFFEENSDAFCVDRMRVCP